MAPVHWLSQRSSWRSLLGGQASRGQRQHGPDQGSLGLFRPGVKAPEAAGFSLSEILVATAVSALVIGTAGIALQSNLRTIQGSSGLINGRDSNATGLALLRADVMRGTKLLFRQGSSAASDNLDASTYQAAISSCQTLAGSTPFNPVFGINQGSASRPVIYGLGLGLNGTSYALRRCGPPINSSVVVRVLSTVIEGIAPIPCADGRSTCPSPSLDANGNATDLPGQLAALSNTLGSDNSSPARSARQPAFRFRTDAERLQLELIDPTASGDGIDRSFTSTDPTGVSMRAPLYLTARVQSNEATQVLLRSIRGICTNCTLYGLPIAGERIYFILDGSFSMSTCTRWGRENDINPNNETRTYWNPGNGNDALSNAWISTSRVCISTRMQILQAQMRQALQNLDPDVSILLVAYSDSTGTNNRSWPANKTMMMIGAGSNRTEAIAFIESLDDGDPQRWGSSTNSWVPMQTAFNDKAADAAFVVTSNLPNLDYYGRVWNNSRMNDSITPFININKTRTKKLSFNSIAIDLEVSWMRTLSNSAYGTYIKL